MITILDRIATYKREEVASAQKHKPVSTLESEAVMATPPKGFHSALANASSVGFGLIAEVKKASPSKGVICADFNPCEIADSYRRGGATCLSVLTDGPSFQGSIDHLEQVSNAVSLPCLRKDFILDPYQVLEARAAGADCILIIMAMVSDMQASEVEETAVGCGMDCLIEVHCLDELRRAKCLKSRLIGVNNRDLTNFCVSTDTTLQLLPYMPSGTLVVSESGLSERHDLDQMALAGVRCFLIGESLMRTVDRESAVRNLVTPPFPTSI